MEAGLGIRRGRDFVWWESEFYTLRYRVSLLLLRRGGDISTQDPSSSSQSQSTNPLRCVNRVLGADMVQIGTPIGQLAANSGLAIAPPDGWTHHPPDPRLLCVFPHVLTLQTRQGPRRSPPLRQHH